MIDNTVEFRSTPITGDELLLGAGHNREKQLALPDKKEWRDLVTLDINPESGADVVWDLHHLPLPFDDETFEEIHAYEILEHIGQQGDWRTFFAQFDEFYRILKPGGHFFATTPMWDAVWAWSDPGHSRVISSGTITFLDRSRYSDSGENTMTDYRHFFKCDFEIIHAQEYEERFAFVLRKR